MQAEKQTRFLELIVEGSGRLEAAREVQPRDPKGVLDWIDKNEDFRETVEVLERVQVDDALLAAATSGNLAAISSFFTRRRPPAKRALTGPFAEVRRMAESLRPLLKSSD